MADVLEVEPLGRPRVLDGFAPVEEVDLEVVVGRGGLNGLGGIVRIVLVFLRLQSRWICDWRQ